MKMVRPVVCAALCLMLPGCFVQQTLKSELSRYAEPQDGELAHIRLIGSRNVKVYPDSACVSHTVPGSGYPAGPQMGGQRTRDLGMPKTTDMPSHFVEIAAVAGQRIAASFAFHGQTQSPVMGRPGTFERSSSGCDVARSFVPEASRNYEIQAGWDHAGCALGVFELVGNDQGTVRRVRVESQPAPGCDG